MDYGIFEQMDESVWKKNETEGEQVYMERFLETVFMSANTDGKEHIYEKMQGSYHGCDYIEQKLEMEFKVYEWELNPATTLHGGLLATAVDMTCGILVRFMKRSKEASTVHLSVDFLRPLLCHEVFIVCAKINKLGRRIIFLTVEVRKKDSKSLVATASATFV